MACALQKQFSQFDSCIMLRTACALQECLILIQVNACAQKRFLVQFRMLYCPYMLPQLKFQFVHFILKMEKEENLLHHICHAHLPVSFEKLCVFGIIHTRTLIQVKGKETLRHIPIFLPYYFRLLDYLSSCIFVNIFLLCLGDIKLCRSKSIFAS